MAQITVDTPVEEIVRRSKLFNGAHRLANSSVFEPRVIRPNRRVLLPFRDLGLTKRHLTVPEITKAIKALGASPANLYELLQHAEDGHWDGYTEIVALGQVGCESTYGKTKFYVPFLWGAGSNHHVQVQSLDATWTNSDSFLVVEP